MTKRGTSRYLQALIASILVLLAVNLITNLPSKTVFKLASSSSALKVLGGPTVAFLNQTYEMSFSFTNIPKNSYLEIYLYPHLNNRSEILFFSTLSDGNLPLAVSNAVAIAGSGNLTVPLTLLSQPQASGITQSGLAITVPGCITSSCDGVYPLHINVVTNGQVNTVIRLPIAISSQNSSIIHPLTAAINIDLTQLKMNGLFNLFPEVVGELVSIPQIGATVTLSGSQLQALMTSKSLDLRNATKSLLAWNNNQNHEIHVGEEVPLDLAQVTRSPLSDLLTTDLQLAKEAISNTGILPSNYFITNYQIDQRSLDQITSAGISNVIIPDSYIVTPDLKFTITSPIDLQTKSVGSTTALLIDRQLENDFTNTSDSYYNASLLTSDLTSIYEDQPNDPSQRIVIANLALRDSKNFSTLVDFLGGIASTNLLRAESLTNALTTSNSITPETVGSLAKTAPKPIDRVAEIQTAMRKVQSAIGANVSKATTNELLTNVLYATSPLSQGNEISYINANDRILESAFSGIAIPASKSVTISARSSTVPISISAKGLSDNLKVRVTLISDRVRVDGGDSRTVRLTSSNDTVSFNLNVNASGVFRVTIAVTTPDGYIKLGQSNITFDYWAYGYVGTIVTIVFALLLIIWWIRTFSRGRPRNANLLPKEKIAN
ncbi:MAG: hypothetical protein M0019_03700 [Actinomycetota bacterium]|nr:hypothetical protein [Actinomycetota bacterium]